jgi:hypothetical protein
MPSELEADRVDAECTATLARISAEVMETMFFSEAMAVECEHSWLAEAVSVEVGFDGSHHGEMGLALAPGAVPAIASSFLGLDPEETGPRECSQVVLELANILCGAVLSALWPDSALQLAPPKPSAWKFAGAENWHCCLALAEGMLAVSIRIARVGTA